MNTKTFVWLVVAGSSLALQAQESLTYEWDKFATRASSLDDWRTDGRNDIENTMAYQVRHITALRDGLSVGLGPDLDFVQRRERGLVSVSAMLLNHSGEHLFYEGSDRLSGELLAGGHLTLQGKGTLFGRAAYSQRRMEDVRFSYATHPEDYVPYVAGDTLNHGDTHQEIYSVAGGYSKRFGSFHFGADASYEGIAERRVTNPKYANYSYGLRVALNAACTRGRHLMGLRVYPELNHQSATATAMVNSTKFFQFYGFGQWNRRETTGSLSYAREQRYRGVGGELLYVYGGPWKISGQLVYDYRHLLTEEHNFKNLFYADKHYLRGQLAMSRFWNGGNSLHLQWSVLQQTMDGTEQVYEKQMQNEEQHLFDYVLVGANSFYHRKELHADARAKMIVGLPSMQALHVLAGVGLDRYRETYDLPHTVAEHLNVVPEVSLGYEKQGDGYGLECSVQAAWQCNLSRSFDNATNTDPIFARAQAEVPYLLRTENHAVLKADVRYTHRLAKGYGLGVKAGVTRVSSDNRKDFGVAAGVNFDF